MAVCAGFVWNMCAISLFCSDYRLSPKHLKFKALFMSIGSGKKVMISDHSLYNCVCIQCMFEFVYQLSPPYFLVIDYA